MLTLTRALVIAAVSLTVFAANPPAARSDIVQIIGSAGAGGGQELSMTWGVALDSADNVYVVGRYSDNAFKITPAGVITQIIDATGDGTGNLLDRPQRIAVDDSGNVYVAGVATHNAFKITPGGVITQIIDASGDGVGNPLTGPEEIIVDGAANVYIVGVGSDNAFKITPAGVITEIIDETGDGSGNLLDAPQGLAVDGVGNVYLGGYWTRNVFKITPAGVITEIIDETGDGTGHELDGPRGVAVDATGNVFVAGFFSDNVFKVTPAGVISQIADISVIDSPQGIAVDGLGNVFVGGFHSNNAIKITPAELIDEIIDGTGDGRGAGFSTPRGVAVNATGSRAYVGGSFTNNAFKIDLPVVCGNGQLDAGEECDDGNEDSGDGCTACTIDVCFTCIGSPSTCTPVSPCCGDGVIDPGEECDDGDIAAGDCCSSGCMLEAVDTPCPSLEDGNVCTSEVCDGLGVCLHVDNTGACDDGDACTPVDSCTAGVCVGLPEPTSGCRTAPRGVLRVRNHETNEKRDNLIWRWTRGQETTSTALGAPHIDDKPDYTLCVYDQSASQPILRLPVPGGGTCGALVCWKALSGSGTTLEYYNRLTSDDGVQRLRLRAGQDERAKIIMRAKGANLDEPTIPLSFPVTVQLHNEDGECWTATYSDPSRNANGVFRAKPDIP